MTLKVVAARSSVRVDAQNTVGCTRLDRSTIDKSSSRVKLTEYETLRDLDRSKNKQTNPTYSCSLSSLLPTIPAIPTPQKLLLSLNSPALPIFSSPSTFSVALFAAAETTLLCRLYADSSSSAYLAGRFLLIASLSLKTRMGGPSIQNLSRSSSVRPAVSGYSCGLLVGWVALVVIGGMGGEGMWDVRCAKRGERMDARSRRRARMRSLGLSR